MPRFRLMAADVQEMNSPVQVIILSTASPGNGRVIAEALVQRRLAACVNITGVQSVYRWKGDICDDQEVLLIIKTRKSLIDDVMAAIREYHTYELPEMIVIPIIGGYEPYLSWIQQETG